MERRRRERKREEKRSEERRRCKAEARCLTTQFASERAGSVCVYAVAGWGDDLRCMFVLIWLDHIIHPSVW